MLKWIKSKTVWAGVGILALGVADFVSGDQEAALRKALEFLGIIGVRHALWKVAAGGGN